MALLVQQKRVNWAVKKIQELLPKLDGPTVMEIVYEMSEMYLGVDPSVYNDDGDPMQADIEISDLQAVAFASCLAAIYEVRKVAE